jgi:hypothetical protein
MPDHDPLPVEGYRPQAADCVALLKEVTKAEERVLRLLDAMADMPNLDRRWLAIGRTDIERGFMAAVRTVFRPDRVRLPGDGEAG